MNCRSVPIAGPCFQFPAMADGCFENQTIVQKGTDSLGCYLEQTGESRPTRLRLLRGAFVPENTGIHMWQRNCPICRQLLEKKQPTEANTKHT